MDTRSHAVLGMIASDKEAASGACNYMKHELPPQIRWRVATQAEEGGEQMPKAQEGCSDESQGQQELQEQI